LGGIGEALARLDDKQAAREAFARLFELIGKRASDLGSLGGQLFAHGWSHAALALWEAAEKADPLDAIWPANQATALMRLGQAAQAKVKAWWALGLSPGLDAANLVLGELAEASDDLSAAIRHFKAVAKPGAEVLAHLAKCQLLLGDGEAAALAFEQAASLDAAYASQALMALSYRPDFPLSELLARHQAWGRNHPPPERPAWCHKKGTPLRLGFVSADFRHHATGIFLPPLLRHRQRCGWQAILYSNTRNEDGFTQRFRELSDGWRDIRGLSDEEAAQLVRNDGIDILVDLNGHTAGNRLGIFALRPAPVQMAYLDYVSTTGLGQMDYRLHDKLHLTEDEAKGYSEKVLRMDGDIFVYEPPPYAPEVAPPPCLSNGFITFASFNALFKIGEPSIALWCAILNEVKDSRFLMASPGLKYAAARDRLLSLFAKYGVDRDRIELLGEADHQAHLERFAKADLVLDSQPYSGGLTTLEALWMGVPVLTLEGDRVAGRHSASHLRCLGLPELVAANAGDYVAKALSLAESPDALAAMRRQLRQRMVASECCDTAKYADRFAVILDMINTLPCNS
jgi:predicted O-linked N-acetylglucosamine transferase (SPINDLY family)